MEHDVYIAQVVGRNVGMPSAIIVRAGCYWNRGEEGRAVIGGTSVERVVAGKSSRGFFPRHVYDSIAADRYRGFFACIWPISDHEIGAPGVAAIEGLLVVDVVIVIRGAVIVPNDIQAVIGANGDFRDTRIPDGIG